MREIEFRGKDIISGVLVYGDLIHGVGNKCGKAFILPLRVNLAYVKNCDPLDGVEVDPKSVGQFTGLLDKNGKNIFEGDILKIESWSSLWLVIFDDKKGHFTCKGVKSDLKMDYIPYYQCTIIGNVHDNPELLK